MFSGNEANGFVSSLKDVPEDIRSSVLRKYYKLLGAMQMVATSDAAKLLRADRDLVHAVETDLLGRDPGSHNVADDDNFILADNITTGNNYGGGVWKMLGAGLIGMLTTGLLLAGAYLLSRDKPEEPEKPVASEMVDTDTDTTSTIRFAEDE